MMNLFNLPEFKARQITGLRLCVIIYLMLMILCNAQIAQIDYFKEGIELYKKGQYEKAYEVLENAIKESRELNPDIIRFLVFQLEKDILVEMIAKGGKLARTAKRILELSKAALEGYKVSEEERDKLLAILKDEKSPFDRKHIAINKLVLVGKYAIPQLVAGLGDEKNETFRTNAVIALTKFGDMAVIPLVTALKTKNIMQKRNILIVLSNIKNKIASPYISKIAHSKKEDVGIKSFAKSILKKWFPTTRAPTKTLFSKYAYYILKSP
ncbi:MAG: HEAT repeat domain-containing protein, partial [Planctomycetota bacterium]